MSSEKTQLLIEDAKQELGWPIVDIEIPDSGLEKILEKTLREIQPFVLLTKYETLPNASVITLPEDVVYVLEVFRGEPKGGSPLLSAPQLNDNEILFGATAQNGLLWDTGALSGMSSDGLTNYYAMKLFMNTIRGNLATVDFNQNGDKLYIDKATGSDKITIEYVPKIKQVDDLLDPFWYKQVYGLFVANCKISIGRARSKYRIQAAKYELDGPAILQEGIQEKDKILTTLEESGLHLLQLVE